MDSKRDFDIILQWAIRATQYGSFYCPKPIIVTNMDGLEWKRTKYPNLFDNFSNLPKG
jgi:hypothetical protein